MNILVFVNIIEQFRHLKPSFITSKRTLIRIHIYLFICSLFNDAVSDSYYMESNDRIINK
jgi:hypothetical protein